jgi:hypothetical protein
MPRFVILLIVLLLALGALVYFLSHSVEPVGQTVIEENVSADASAQ